MPRSGSPHNDADGVEITRYRPLARVFHWLTVLFIVIQLPVGLYMAYRGPELNIWDAVTNMLYAGHKVIGVAILLLVVTRLVYRLVAGAPSPEPTLTGWQKTISALNHWGMYLLLVTVPALGYLSVSYFPALDIVGPISLPAIVAPDRAMYNQVIVWHAAGAFVLASLVALHVAAALYHHFIRRDGVLARMLPSIER